MFCKNPPPVSIAPLRKPGKPKKIYLSTTASGIAAIIVLHDCLAGIHDKKHCHPHCSQQLPDG
jgi:hypothetical protein